MNNETVLGGFSKGDKGITIFLFAAIGGVIGWFLPTIAGWLLKLPFIPMEGLFEWIATTDNQLITIITPIVGALAGIALALYAFYEALTITVTDEEIKLNSKQKEKVIQKQDISTIFLDGKHLVILGKDDRELFRGEHEEKKKVISETFQDYGYAWSNSDPLEEKYKRWVPDHPDFPNHVNALLAARERALEEDDEEEVKILRKDLADIGVYIRDKNERQYVRISQGGHT